MEENLSYRDYYLATILDGENGLKPVRGATGLGKTYGMIQAVKGAIDTEIDKKFIYTTNRHALIREVQQDFEKLGIRCAYLKSNKEILSSLVESSQPSLTTILHNLVDEGFFDYDKKLGNKKNEEIKKFLDAKIQRIKANKEICDPTIDDDDGDDNILDTLLIKLGRIIKRQFYEIKKHNDKLLEKLFINPDIWVLFPYIQFQQDPATKVLLGTIQKFSYGFFDGKKKLKLPDLGGNIIFLDEFDFLENEILKILCLDNSMNNPLEFVKIFYERFGLLKNKSFWEPKGITSIKDGLEEAYDYLRNCIRQNKYKFPALTDFAYNSKMMEKRLVLFQTNKTILSEKFYLDQEGDTWVVTNQHTATTVEPKGFFQMIRDVIQQILAVFNKHSDTHPQAINQLIQKLWNIKNDNTSGEYQTYIDDTIVYKNISVEQSETHDEDFSYTEGFDLIEIKQNDALDPLDADLTRLELSTSPEAIIKKLAENNLVFALSATSDLPRVVSCFNESWLTENTPFIVPSEDDEELVKKLKHIKDNKRRSNTRFTANRPISKAHPITDILNKLKILGFFDNDESDITNDKRENRKKRVLKFFGCLEWILNDSQNRSHLVFLTTFRHIKDIITHNTDLKENIAQIFSVEPRERGYKIIYADKTFNIIFLNSSEAKAIEADEADSYNHLMSDATVDKVILVTQYATASNGVNLGFKDEEGIKRDFEGVHLLEAKYYWFDTNIEEKHRHNTTKQMFWYNWKLFERFEITQATFEWYLQQPNISFMNSAYQKTGDFVLNSMALFHQALGRVERQRAYEQPLIEVTLADDVLVVFRNFFKDAYQEMPEIQKREAFTATLITQLNEEVKEYFRTQHVKIQQVETQNISTINNKSIEFIQKVLAEIENIKNGTHTDEDIINEIIITWQKIRQYALQQDYNAEIEFIHTKHLFGSRLDFKQQFVFETTLLDDETLHLTYANDDEPGYDIYPKPDVIQENLYQIDLNKPFMHICENTVVERHFKANGFLLHYRNTPYPRKSIFTPYIEQAILRGAIGEEVIKALLESKKIELEEVTLPSLFEVFDAKIKKLPVYIDFKNFSKQTIDRFAIPEDNILYDRNFDPMVFAEKVSTKLKKIKVVTGEKKAKYVVINMKLEGFINQYFTEDLEQVGYYKDCDIAIIPSALAPKSPNRLYTGFNEFIKHIKQELKQISKEL